MKTAVFQICKAGTGARLVCVPMESLRGAAELEAWIKMHADESTEITLLGRFDLIQAVASPQEAESLILQGAAGVADVVITL